MDRRKFSQILMAVAGSGTVIPARVFAGSVKDSRTGGIYYTKDAPGRWSEKIAGHVPNIEVNKTNGKVVVKVVTAHGMNGYDHYIVKHILLDKDYSFSGSRYFCESLFWASQPKQAAKT